MTELTRKDGDTLGLITYQEFDKKLSDKIDKIYDSVMNDNVRSSSLSRGLQVVHSDRVTPLQLEKIEGRTVVNLVPTFDSPLWNIHPNAVVDSPTKITLNAVGDHETVLLTSIPVKPNTTYTISMITNGRYYVRDIDNSSPFFTLVSSDGQRYKTFKTAANTTRVAVHLSNHLLGAGTYTYENVMLNEGSEPLDYVSELKNVSGVYIRRHGNNLLPPFYEWEINSEEDVTIHDSYSATIRTKSGTTSGAQGIRTFVSVIPGEEYSLSAKNMPVGSRIRVSKNNSSSFAGGTFINELNGGIEESITFTIPEDTDEVVIAIIREADSTHSGVVITVDNVMFNYGDPLPFEPQENNYLYANVELASSLGGGNPETLEFRDGKYWKSKKFERLILDGSLDWEMSKSFPGYKRVGLSASNFLGRSHTQVVVKHNGAILVNSTTNEFTAGDQVIYNKDFNIHKLQLTISNEESGWGDNYSPTSEEIKAFFNGWKMHTVGNRASQYNGTGTKGWYPITRVYDEWIPEYKAEVNVPLYPANNKEGWKPYYIQYQLDKNVLEDVTDKVEGSINLTSGDNLIEVGEAVVVRERAKLYEHPSNGRIYINAANEDYKFKYRSRSIIDIYKNGAIDNSSWVLATPRNPNTIKLIGYQQASTPVEKVDLDAEYEVTYIALPYQLSSEVCKVDVEYATTLKTALDKTIQQIADVEARVSEFPKIYAHKHQEEWMVPTLLSGYTRYSNSTVRYFKNSIGVVHVIAGLYSTGGTETRTVETELFILPEGYRPSETILVTAADGFYTSTKRLALVKIQPDGKVKLASDLNSNYLYFNTTFRAK